MSAPGGPQVKPGAACTIMAEIAATVTKGYEGALKKVIDIETNDPHTPLISLTFKASVYARLSAEPRFVNFGEVKRGSAPRRELRIRNRGDKSIAIAQIAISPIGSASISPQRAFVLKPGATMKLSIALSPTLPVGPNYGKVILSTNWQELPEKMIRFRAIVIGGMR